jgi:hypothetical protein
MSSMQKNKPVSQPAGQNDRRNSIDFDAIDGIEFGGQSEILHINVDEAAGPFIYAGKNVIDTDIGKAVSHSAHNEAGEQVRMPLSATFIKAIDMANLGVGDAFYVKRYADVIGKTGRAKGQTLQVYSIKVVSRADVTPAS